MALLLLTRAAHAADESTCGASGPGNILGLLMPLSSVDACSAMLAINHSNLNDGSVVPEFESSVTPPLFIEPLMNDTNSDPATGVASYRALLSAGATALVGAGRSSVTTPVALLSAHNVLPMVSYISSSPTLSDSGSDGLYSSFARVFPSDRTVASFFFSVGLQLFGWEHYSILHVSNVYGRSYAEELVNASWEAGAGRVMSQVRPNPHTNPNPDPDPDPDPNPNPNPNPNPDPNPNPNPNLDRCRRRPLPAATHTPPN